MSSEVHGDREGEQTAAGEDEQYHAVPKRRHSVYYNNTYLTILIDGGFAEKRSLNREIRKKELLKITVEN